MCGERDLWNVIGLLFHAVAALLICLLLRDAPRLAMGDFAALVVHAGEDIL